MLSPPSHLRTVLRILAIWLLLAVLWPQDAIHPDSTHDLLMVRDCLELQRCDTAGPMSSWHGVHQGALWVNGLALARSLWTPLGTALFLTLLNAIAIVVTADWLHARSTHAQSTLPLLVATALGTTSVVLVMPTALWPLVLVSSCLFLQLLETPARSGFALLAVLLGYFFATRWRLFLRFHSPTTVHVRIRQPGDLSELRVARRGRSQADLRVPSGRGNRGVV